jgi:hypothetical protein
MRKRGLFFTVGRKVQAIPGQQKCFTCHSLATRATLLQHRLGETGSVCPAPHRPVGGIKKAPCEFLHGNLERHKTDVLGKLAFGSITLVRPRWPPSVCVRLRSRGEAFAVRALTKR